MIPVRVCVENFMSYRQKQELFFDRAPLWVLSGENGAGKSTIFDAITFALYNFHRGGKTNHKDLINHQEDSLAVEFDFLINDLQYRICRTVSRRSAATRQISEIVDSKVRPISNTDNDTGFKEWVENNIGLNENAFTSCVLLSQGNSDKLLTAKPTERFTILKQIIDISAYEKLHEQADNLRKESEGEYKTLARQLEDIETVTPEQVKEAQEQLDRAKKNWQAIQERVEKLNQLIQQAKQWEQLQKQIQEQKVEKHKLQQLIDRSEEITTNFNRFEELKLVIPKIENIIKTKERLTDLEAEILDTKQSLQQIEDNLSQVKTEQQESDKECDRLQQSIEELQNNLQQINTQLSKTAPLIAKLEQYEEIKSNCEQCDRQIAAFPSNLLQQVDRQEKYYQQLVEIKNTLPWLKNIVESRSSLNNAIQQQQQAETELRSLEFQLTESQQKEQQLNANLKTIEQKERDLSNRISLQQNEYQRINKQLQSFEKAVTKPTCELCGQEITAEHAQREKQRLNQNLADIEDNLNNLQQQYSTVTEKLTTFKTNLVIVQNQIEQVKEKANDNKNIQQQTQTDIQRLLQQLARDWENLLPSDRTKISHHQPKNESQWLVTVYPSDRDLEELERQANTVEIYKQKFEDLQQQLETYKQLNDRRQTLDWQLAECETKFSVIEAKEAKLQYDNWKESQQQYENNIQNVKEELNKAKEQKNKINAAVESYLKRSQNIQIDLTGKQTSQSKIEHDLQVQFNELPKQWQQESWFSNERLCELDRQKNRLIEYEELAKQLNNARQTIENIERQIDNYQKQIKELPVDAYCSFETIEQELITTKGERNIKEQEKSNVEKNLHQLQDTRKRYAQIERDKLQAERNSSLYKVLAKLLGKDGIQTHLLRNAEKAIIKIANEILDSLSRGKIRLELREANRNRNEALDLVAYNFATGEQPTAVALTSGSQRFRIAVSLALAIGQYVGNNARNIESVIIDEGFGSLDKNGRDDMIEELNALKQRLKRIILVSHQEEFFNEFNNGYQIKLVEGASQACLFESGF